MKLSASLLAAGLIVMTAPVAFADDWADFELHNGSNFTIVSFTTNEGDGWSSNWLGRDRLEPGAAIEMRFSDRKGPCDVQFRVTASDGYKYEYTGNFCRIQNLYVYDKSIKWD
ncbi:hypothetical protein [Enhydrobacter aerosaccus]|nr:hypothetical protein [Enhydrobacter aerosaccus]